MKIKLIVSKDIFEFESKLNEVMKDKSIVDIKFQVSPYDMDNIKYALVIYDH